MPRYSRKELKTTYVHVITQGINKSYIFEKEEDIKFYIKNMYEIKNSYKVSIIAYCIMNNHAHMLIEVDNVKTLGKYMHKLNTIYGIYYNKKNNRVGYVFRDRYKSEGIFDNDHLNNCINYIYNNPVKANICKWPWEYKFSNYKKNINLSDKKYYTFMDVDENKEEICKKEVEKFLSKNNVSLNELKNNKNLRVEMVKKLKNENNISLRMIARELKLGKETIRKDLLK